jgi:cbb3-type cytochrome oxidase subunit 1
MSTTLADTNVAPHRGAVNLLLVRRIDVSFLVLATVLLIVGIFLGIGMGIARDFQLVPVHAHVNLVGWTSMALFGLVYRAYPALAVSRLAVPHLALWALGALLFPVGIYLSVVHEILQVAIIGSAVWLLGALIFLGNLLRTLVFASSAKQATREAIAKV